MKQFPKLNILNHNFPRYETGEKTKTSIVSFFHYQHQHHRNRNRNIQSCVGWPEAADLSDLNESWCKLSEPLWPALGQSGKIAQLIKISISTFPLWVLRCQLDWVRDMGGSGQVRGDNVTTQAGKVSLRSHVASPLCTLPWWRQAGSRFPGSLCCRADRRTVVGALAGNLTSQSRSTPGPSVLILMR